MPAQTQVLTERQLELLTKAAQESDGCIEPHLHLKGGVKVRMIDFFAARGLIAQVNGQWQITSAARAIVEGHSTSGSDPLSPSRIPEVSLADDPEIEAAVTAAESSWQAIQARPRVRADSKQAQVIALLQRSQGCTITEIMTMTGWQAHTVRGTFAGALKKRGLMVTSEKPAEGERIYRLATT